MRYWTEEENAYLINNYVIFGKQHCAKNLNRSNSAVAHKAQQLKLKSPTSFDIRKSTEKYREEISNTEYECIVEYVTARVPILHRHKNCGHIWSIKPTHILSGHGCPKCRGNNTKTLEEYRTQLLSTEYDTINYLGAKVKSIHKHISCGYEWLVTPNDILSGKGCPQCAGRNSNIVYILHFPELDLYKVGITNNLARRITQFGYSSTILFIQEYNTGNQAYNIEQQILKWLGVRLVNTGKLISGNTETFR